MEDKPNKRSTLREVEVDRSQIDFSEEFVSLKTHSD